LKAAMTLCHPEEQGRGGLLPRCQVAVPDLEQAVKALAEQAGRVCLLCRLADGSGGEPAEPL
jgi:hypothetical protein